MFEIINLFDKIEKSRLHAGYVFVREKHTVTVLSVGVEKKKRDLTE